MKAQVANLAGAAAGRLFQHGLYCASYPSNHTSGTNGGTEVMRRLYGEGRHAITLSNPAVPDIALQYSTFKQISDDVDDARVYAGIQFRTDQDAGRRLGRAVGIAVYKNNLRPLHDDE